MIKLWNKIKVKYYNLMGIDIVFRLKPTKELYEYCDRMDAYLKGKTEGDLKNTNIDSPAKVGELAIWVPYRTKELKYKKQGLVDSNLKAEKYPVKIHSREDYSKKLRETIKEAIKSNTTIH